MSKSIAAQLIDSRQYFPAGCTVQCREEGEGDDIAPHNCVCGDDEDCNECPYSELCSRCIHPGEEEEDDDDCDE